MSRNPFAGADTPELTALSSDFLETTGANLLGRWDAHQDFWDARLAAGLDSYMRSSAERIGPETVALTRGHERIAGVNFASQDYLSLASHPHVCAAATEAVARWGVHSAGSLALQGGSVPLTVLEDRLGELLCCDEVTVFPTGWAAGYGTVKALVREDDHIVLDIVAHACLQEAAANATKNIHRVPNCSHTAVASRLARIRERAPDAGILVITEGLFSMDSTVPDLRAMQEICHAYQATLMVDVAHDLGALCDGGLGFIGDQGLLGEIDIVMGSFSKTFASNGGFVATNARGIKLAFRSFSNPLTFSNALSPVQAATVNAAIDIIRSREGAERRRRLMQNTIRLREGLAARAFQVLGQPSAIVPVWLGPVAQARRMTRTALSMGALVNLVEHPAVSRQNSRWRLQVMADHTPDQIDRLIAIAVAARETADTDQPATTLGD
jgi:glycine C-acetyltransferase